MEVRTITVHFRYDLLQTRRKELRLTQEILAELCDCSPRYLWNLESGKKRNPSAILLRRIAFVLKVPMEDLLAIRDEPWYRAAERHPGAWARRM